jgi:hypothetical protein
MMAGVLVSRLRAREKGDEHERRRKAANERWADHMSPISPLSLLVSGVLPSVVPIEFSSRIPAVPTWGYVDPIPCGRFICAARAALAPSSAARSVHRPSAFRARARSSPASSSWTVRNG